MRKKYHYHFAIWTCLVLSPFYLYAQGYFQQEVNYLIQVELDTDRHYLSGNIEISYTNNSEENLGEMYFHLWPNAYSEKNTAFAKQKIAFGESSFYFAPESSLGFIDQLDFKLNGYNIDWALTADHPDIALLKLTKPINSGETVKITTPFRIKLPSVFSRLGHENGYYQITQWYPKPAVYDKNGWNFMPYLDMGEFYSEFGNYEVEISLPRNYVVAATGILQTLEEQKFISDIIELSKDKENWPGPKSTNQPGNKTIVYRADSVHDFAWFASKEFMINHKEIILKSGKTIEAYTFYASDEHKMWQDAIEYSTDAIEFFSEEIGDYPYPQVSVVRSRVAAGGGMEYPMITVIDELPSKRVLDGVIAHEIAHNWFYGSLGSNERNHPWMDEGMTTFYELKYLRNKYKGKDPYDYFLPPLVSEEDFELSSSQYMYLFQARRNYDQSSGLHSEEYTPVNYALSVYHKPALVLEHLERYLGEKTFQGIMKKYVSQWSGKHPGPDDFSLLFVKETGKDLNWVFEDLLYSRKKLDYKLNSITLSDGEYQIELENKGEIASPVELNILKGDKELHSLWVEGFTGKKQILVKESEADAFELDAANKTIDINRKNNYIGVSGLMPRARNLDLSIFSTTENSRKSKLNILPILGGNAYDKFMLGLWLFDPVFPEHKFHFSVLPLYGFGSKELVGIGHLQYSFFPDSDLIRRIKLGSAIRSFHKDRNKDLKYDLRYLRVSPSLTFNFVSNQKSLQKNQLTYRTHFIKEDFINFFSQDSFDIINENSLVHKLEYDLEKTSVLNPWSLRFEAEQQSYQSLDGEDQDYLKLTAIYRSKLRFQEDKSIDLRFFASFFPRNTQRASASHNKRIARGSIALLHQGFNDYSFEEYNMGRSEQNGIWSRQIDTHRGGGFKNALSSSYSIGQSNDYAVALNIKFSFPFDIPIISMFRPYFDVGYYNFKATSSSEYKGTFLYSGGLMLDFPEEILSIHFPLFYSNAIKTAYNDLGGFGARISFHLNLNKFNPYNILEEIH